MKIVTCASVAFIRPNGIVCSRMSLGTVTPVVRDLSLSVSDQTQREQRQLVLDGLGQTPIGLRETQSKTRHLPLR